MPEETPSHWFSPLQKRILTTAAVVAAISFIALFLFGVLVLLRSFVGNFSSVIWPLAVAGVLSLILRPLVLFFERHIRLSRVKAIMLLYALVLLACAAIASFLIPLLVEQGLLLIEELPEIINRMQSALQSSYPSLDERLAAILGADWVEQSRATLLEILQAPSGISAQSIRSAGDQALGIMGIAAGLAIVPVYLFFFLSTDRDPSRDLESQLSFLPRTYRDDIVFLIREFAGSMVAFFRGQILIGLIMGVLMSIGFYFAGLEFSVLLGLILGFLNIVPYLGTILGLGTVLPLALFQPGGGIELVLIVLAVFAAVQLIEGYLLTPRIMGETTGLHPLTIIIAIFFWGVALNGILGMVLAIPLTAFFVVAWRLVRRKYLRDSGMPEPVNSAR